MTTVSTDLETILPGLHASAPEALPFGPDLEIRAYLLERDEGNVLVYRSAAIEEQAGAVRERGGISRQYLNHSHEASPACDWVADTFGAPLLVHEADAQAVARSARVGHTFSRRHTIGGDLEVIPIPGHTPGATAYLWDSGEHRVLFTGDTLMVGRDGWSAALLDSSDRDSYIESLELIRGLDFDVLVPSIARAGRPTHAHTDRTEIEQQVGAVIDRIRAGSSH